MSFRSDDEPPAWVWLNADGDHAGYDRAQDSRWDDVAGRDFFPASPPDGLPPVGPTDFHPPEVRYLGVVPGPAVRGVDPIPDADGPSPVGVQIF